MLRQIFISLLILIGAGAAYVSFVPGARETLARLGLDLPFAAAATPTEQTRPGGGREAGTGGPQAGGSGAPQAGGSGRPGGGRGGTNRTPTVVVADVTSATINDRLAAIGEGMAVRSAVVSAPSGGMLVELLVAPGDRVEAGDVIGRLDSESEGIALDKARLAEADAQQTLQRTRELANANSISTAQLATVQLAASNAALELRDAELALERRSIVSPIAGTVGLLQATTGNYVTAQTPITTVDDIAEILVRFYVPERYAPAIATGMKVEAAAVALPAETFAGTISATDNRIDPASRTLQVEALLPNPGLRLRPGMSFSVALSFPGQAFAAVDPLAIQWSSEGAYVWRYAEGRVDRAGVRVVQRNSDGVLVDGEVKPGDQVVTEGVLQLTVGGEVALLGAEPAGAQAGARTPEGSRGGTGNGDGGTQGRPAATPRGQ